MGDPPRVICLEGPSAVGKTTLLAALEREHGAAVVPELDAGPPPPIGASAAWFAARGAERWRLAREKAAGAPFAAMDGDPLKGLWYNWVFADEGWEQADAVAPLLQAEIDRGALAFPDLYVVLTATEAQLRQRRADDATRARRGFEKHLRLVEPLRRYFSVLQAADPPRVLFLDTTDRGALPGRVRAAVRHLPSDPPNSARLLEHAAAWLRAHPDAAHPQD